MSTISYGTVAGSSYGITLSPTTENERPKTPSGLIVTRAVQVKSGWLGQVIVDKEVVWESTAQEDGDEAIHEANARVVEVFKVLFGWERTAEVGE